MGNKIRYRFAGLLLVLTAILNFTYLYSQDSPVKPSRQAAMNAFSKGNYEEAFRDFGVLLENYTQDPLYKYYSGVCLVKLSREPGKAMAFLKDAVNNPKEIKSVPDDSWFYLGRSQQMSGRFAEAIKSFNNFSSKSGKRIARTYNVAQYIQECNEGKGQVKEAGILNAEIPDTKAPPTIAESHQAVLAKAEQTPDTKPQSQREKLPEKYDKMLTEGMDYQVKADSLNDVAAEYRKVYGQLPPSQKTSYKTRISEADSLGAYYQSLADQKLGTGNQEPAVKKDTVIPKTSQQVKPVPADENQSLDNEPAKAGINSAGSSVVQEGGEVYSLFAVIKDPVQVQSQKIEIDPQLPAGLMYRIQMGVFSKPVTATFFKGISPVAGFKVPSSGMIRYFAGMFRRSADANKALLAIKQLGFKDSFLVAISDGTPVSLERAASLEKEWGSKPLFKAVPVQNKSQAAENTPPTLSFRVEVTRSAKPLNDDIIETYRRTAGNRGFEILSAEEGSTVYLIGKFITFESASEYAGLLNRNGYREAKVVAYLGNKEIPVETAKELFEKIE